VSAWLIRLAVSGVYAHSHCGFGQVRVSALAGQEAAAEFVSHSGQCQNPASGGASCQPGWTFGIAVSCQ